MLPLPNALHLDQNQIVLVGRRCRGVILIGIDEVQFGLGFSELGMAGDITKKRKHIAWVQGATKNEVIQIAYVSVLGNNQSRNL